MGLGQGAKVSDGEWRVVWELPTDPLELREQLEAELPSAVIVPAGYLDKLKGCKGVSRPKWRKNSQLEHIKDKGRGNIVCIETRYEKDGAFHLLKAATKLEKVQKSRLFVVGVPEDTLDEFMQKLAGDGLLDEDPTIEKQLSWRITEADMAKGRADWPAAVGSLRPLSLLKRFGEDEQALKFLGIALTKLPESDPTSADFVEGLSFLRRASERPGATADTFSSYGGALKRAGRIKEAFELYNRAWKEEVKEKNFKKRDSYPLGNVIELGIELGRTLDLELVQNGIKLASFKESNFISLPWTSYDLAKFRFLAGETKAGHIALLRAISHSVSDDPIASFLDSLERIDRSNSTDLSDAIALCRLALTRRIWQEADRDPVVLTDLDDASAALDTEAPVHVVEGPHFADALGLWGQLQNAPSVTVCADASSMLAHMSYAFRTPVLLTEEPGTFPESWEPLNGDLDVRSAEGDLEIARAYVALRTNAIPLPEALREQLGQIIHERYREKSGSHLSEDDPAAVGWLELQDDLKEVNRRSADDVGRKLRRLGLSIVTEDGDGHVLNLDDAQVEKLAKMEHGHWVVTKWSQGWRHDKKKDNARKRHPMLVPWSRRSSIEGRPDGLSEEARDKDRNVVRLLPELLELAGWRVRRSR